MNRNKKKTLEGRGKRLLLFVFKYVKFVVLINSQPLTVCVMRCEGQQQPQLYLFYSIIQCLSTKQIIKTIEEYKHSFAGQMK